MKKVLTLCILAMMLSTPALLAQDTITEIIIKRIYISKHPQDPEYPQFIVYSRDNNSQMGFGGYVKLTGAFDFNGMVDSYDFITYDIPIGTGDLKDKRLYLDAHQSRIFVEVLSHVKRYPMRIYIETDFYSEHNFPRLRHAYAQYKGFLVGQTWSTLMDLDAMPNTVDFEGPNSAVSLRAPMIRYSYEFTKGFRISAATELPDVSLTYIQPYQEAFQYIPDLIFAVRTPNKFGHLQFGAVLRTMMYKDTSQHDISHVFGTGGTVSGKIKISKKGHFMFQGVAGTGISKYIQDISGVGMDAVAEQYKYYTEMEPLLSWGFYVGYQHNWGSRLNSTFTYGLTRIITSYSLPGDEEYKQGQYALVNLEWHIIPNMAVAIEYIWGQRTNWGYDQGRANRINGMVRFNF